LSATHWFVWFFASAAFALGPAYQLQAARDTVPLCPVTVPSGALAAELVAQPGAPSR
jgi:hypothetical protein